MKAITIKQPFASLIANGIKEYEFRTWKTKYRGKLLIHAGKSVDKKAMEKFACYNLDYPLGCIIGICDLSDCIKIDDNARKMLLKKNNLVYYHVGTDTTKRIEFLVSVGMSEDEVSKRIPENYSEIPDFIWLDIIKNFLGKLDDMEDEFNAIGMLKFAISGHTEGKHFLPWQMFDKSRYCS